MKLLSNFLYTILSLQDKVLRFRLSKTINAKNKSKRKRIYSKGCLLDLNSLADVEKQKLEEEITNILQVYNYDPVKILEYVKEQGTNVYYIDNAATFLNRIGENEGFILPTKSFKALFLSLLVEKSFRLHTSEMFILSTKGEINKYFFIYHFYNWFAYKNNIAGLDTESQDLLRKFLYTNEDTSSLQLDEIYKLKDAIKQDKASIEFVIKLCRNVDGAKKALDKLKNKDGARL